MAEARTRVSCQTDCAAMTPSVDVLYEDLWTDAAVRLPDAAFAYRYADVRVPPTASACMTSWTPNCRAVIHYEQHIHPLWSLPRQVLDPNDNVTVIENNTCTQAGCHSPVDAQAATQVPAAQLDLTDGLSPNQADHFNAYRELLFGDNDQEVVNGALQDVVVPATDEDGNPILVNVPVTSPMSAAGANASNRFFSKFDAGGTHAGFISAAELRLVAEWLDIGAQYYNDPFEKNSVVASRLPRRAAKSSCM
jgi:hypothetical protein